VEYEQAPSAQPFPGQLRQTIDALAQVDRLDGDETAAVTPFTESPFCPRALQLDEALWGAGWQCLSKSTNIGGAVPRFALKAAVWTLGLL
jgi:hypothetical protein